MKSDRTRFDIFACCHSDDFPALRTLLPHLLPYGVVHVASSFLKPDEVEALRGECDFVHQPRHSQIGYENFNLFCVRDINRLATAPHFIKMDCDVVLRDDWIDYVEEVLLHRPDAVLFGTHSGTNRLEFDLSGPLVRRRLGADVRVRGGLKVNGSFYVGRSDFFRDHDHTMQVLHDLLYAFRGGRRIRPSPLGDDGAESDLGAVEAVKLRGTCRNREGMFIEDELRSLTVHVAGAGRRLFVEDAAGRITLPDKMMAPSRLKLATKWIRRRLGIPMPQSRSVAGRRRERPLA